MSDEHSIRAIGDAIDSLIKTLDRQTRELRPLLSSLEKMPEMMRDSQVAIQQAASDTQRVQVESQLIPYTAQLDVDRDAILAERALLEQKVAELRGDLERLAARYFQLLDGVQAEAERAIHELDAPVLHILDKLYPSAVAEPYRAKLIPGRGGVDARARDCRASREAALEVERESLLAHANRLLEHELEGDPDLAALAKALADQDTELEERLIPVAAFWGGPENDGMHFNTLGHGPSKAPPAEAAERFVDARGGPRWRPASGAQREALADALRRIAEKSSGVRRTVARKLARSVDAQKLQVLGWDGDDR